MWGRKQKRIESLAAGVHAIFRDRVIDPQEEASFWQVHERLGLSAEDSLPLRLDAFEREVRAVLAQGGPTPEQMHWLESVYRFLRLPADHPRVGEAVRSLWRARVFREVAAGQLPVLGPAHTQLNLQQGEVGHFETAAEWLDERVERTGYRGGSSGFSFRVAPGVRWHVGWHRGRTVSRRVLAVISRGVLTLTDRRLAFVGDQRSTSVPWRRLLGATPSGDGLVLAVENRAKNLQLRIPDPRDREIVARIVTYYLDRGG